jgi:hypothetical protein
MSIAGIAKEVSTITISAWFFGDELTPLNITGVGITTCGEFTPSPHFKDHQNDMWHRYCIVHVSQVPQIYKL